MEMRAGFRREAVWIHVQRSENPVILLWSLGVSIELQRAQPSGSVRVGLHQQLEWIESHRGNTPAGASVRVWRPIPTRVAHSLGWGLEIKREKVSRAPVFISLLPDYGSNGPATPHPALLSLPWQPASPRPWTRTIPCSQSCFLSGLHWGYIEGKSN